MKTLVTSLTILVVLSGCAAFNQPAQFSLDDYPGATPLERKLAKINLELNRVQACSGKPVCQPGLPSREELAAASFFDCKAYVMGKAYALQDAGVDASRMRVALFNLKQGSHVVLVVDERYVLDNLDGSVRQISEYARFEPLLARLPSPLMAGRGESPLVLTQASAD